MTSLLIRRTHRAAAFCLALAVTAAAGAQNDYISADTADSTSIFITSQDSLVSLPRYEVDRLVRAWYANAVYTVNEFVADTLPASSSAIASIDDSVYVERLQAMMSPIPLSFNNQVRSYIELYVVKRRDLVQRMLGLSNYYFPIFERALDACGMPLELRFLPIIESALRPEALSRAGASGLWQFMYYTGRRYGLEVTSYVDDRRDPIKATAAAARYLRDLYRIYGDWLLAIAAYNCGPGNVDRAIKRSGGVKDFWKLYYQLPRETRGYVPAFIAAAYAMTYAKEHRLFPTDVSMPTTAVDTVMICQPLHFKQIQSVLGIDDDLIRRLNPQYKVDVVPAKAGKCYPLVLPVDDTFAFAAAEDSIYARDRKLYFPDNKIVNASSAKDAASAGRAPAGKAKLLYTVREGDVPGSVAKKFGIKLSDLVYWNNIRRNIIRVGQKLVIYVPKGEAERYLGVAKQAK